MEPGAGVVEWDGGAVLIVTAVGVGFWAGGLRKTSFMNGLERMISGEIRKVETQMDTSIDAPSHRLQEPRNEGDPFADSTQEDDDMQEDEVITEVARIIEDLENGIVEPTLARLGAEDVALDMDDTFVHEDDDWSDSSSEGSVDGVEEEG